MLFFFAKRWSIDILARMPLERNQPDKRAHGVWFTARRGICGVVHITLVAEINFFSLVLISYGNYIS